MKKWIGIFVFVALSGAAVVSARASASAPQLGVTQVVCDGAVCGGVGGHIQCSGSQFCYRVKPNGNSITSLEVGVDDGDITHYTSLCGPAGWTMSIASISRSHDPVFTMHGVVTGKSGSCPFVLRFQGGAQTATFEVGYHYNPDFFIHDVTWHSSDGRTAGWTFPLGTNNGPVHSPVDAEMAPNAR